MSLIGGAEALPIVKGGTAMVSTDDAVAVVFLGSVSMPTLAAGNNNIGDVDVASIAAGTNNIGDVDVASIATGANYIGQVGAVPKPLDYSTFGHYAAVLTTGTVASNVGDLAEIAQMRWVDATRFCAIQEVAVLEFYNIANAFNNGRFVFDVIKSTAWTADGTGGSAVAVATPQLKLRTSMGATLFSTGFRIATTADLGAGTKTLNTLPFGATYGHTDNATAQKHYIPQANVAGANSAAAGAGVVLFKVAPGEHPILLVQNEGISIRATMPDAGDWVASFLVKWAEVASY